MFGNPVQGPRIIPHGSDYTVDDKLPNGRPAFRVTQPFGNPDVYFPGYRHTGMDIGNFHCGDDVIAAASGRLLFMRDGAGAIGARVQLSNGWKVDVWHLAATVGSHGQWISKGQRIGRIGSTGLNIGGCHGHIEAIKPDGTRVDIWPLLEQNIELTYRRLNGPGINIRDEEPWGPIYATSREDGIYRSDGKKIGSLTRKMRQRRTALRDGDYWVELYLDGGYRWVMRKLTTRVE